jgi:predicted metal-dependent hydrolase
VDAQYLAFFEEFNRQRFFEAHEALEGLWLADRKGPDAAFYKGLIQLAGAFVHLQKDRLRPAAALFRLAGANLQAYPAIHDQLDVAAVRLVVEQWLSRLEAGSFSANPLRANAPPTLDLERP